MIVRVRHGRDRSRRPTWFAELDGREVASGKELAGEIVWDADPDLADAPAFVEALHAELERLHRYGYCSSAVLDQHIQEGRVRALNN